MRHGGYGPFDDNDDNDNERDGDHTAADEAFGGSNGFGGFGARAEEGAEEVVAAVVAPARRARPAPGLGARPRPGRPPDRAGPGRTQRPDRPDHREPYAQRAQRAPYAQRAQRAPYASRGATPPGAGLQRPLNPTPPPDRADPVEHTDLDDETLSAVARDLWRVGVAWVGSIHRPLLMRLAGVLVVLVVVMTVCASVLQASLHPTLTTAPTTRSALASSSATTAPTKTPTKASAATGGRFTGIVAVSYWAGHKLPFTTSVTVTATLSWATTDPAPFSCGNYTFTFSGYNRPQNITCQLNLPTGADGVNAEQFQNCAPLHDPNATTLCWDNPAQFWHA